MKYFVIAGEASGDLHGAHLIHALRHSDPKAQFRFLGGDMMAQQADAAPLIHYRDMAYMGFVEVIKHLGQILTFMRQTKKAIADFQPDVLVLIDYPSFNLKVAQWAKQRGIRTAYYISPKVWVWKQWRVRTIKRCIDRMLCILPFETEFYRKHGYSVQYVGNPTVSEIKEHRRQFGTLADFATKHHLDPFKPILAIVPGSRRQELRDNLPTMLQAASKFPDMQVVVAGAPGLEAKFYDQFLSSNHIPVIFGATYELVHHATVAVVTSGTATLETAVIGTPQVACYRMSGRPWIYKLYRRLLRGKYVTLPNLIADEPVIPELLIHHCTAEAIATHVHSLRADTAERQAQLAGYDRMMQRLGTADCSTNAAQAIIALTKE